MIHRLIVSASLAAALGCDGPATPPPAAIGSPAPAYHATTIAGDSVTLEQFKGQAVLLNVWATWCEPCREEMPALERLHQEFGPQGLRVVASSIDVRTANHDVSEFVSQHNITFTILRDPDNRISRVFQLPGVPNTILINRAGTIVHRWIGPFDPVAEDAVARVRQALGG